MQTQQNSPPKRKPLEWDKLKNARPFTPPRQGLAIFKKIVTSHNGLAPQKG